VRIALFTVEDSLFVPEFLRPLLDRRGGEIVQAYFTGGPFDLGGTMGLAGRLIRAGYPWCIRPSDWLGFARAKLGSKVDSVESLLRRNGIPIEPIRDLKKGTRKQLRALDADVFLFAPFNLIAGPKTLGIPRLGTFNVHMGKLPEHRGGLSAFWVLAQGHETAGATMHRAVPEIDAGEIVAECRVPVETRSMRELMTATFRAAGEMAADGLDRIEAGGWEPIVTAGRPEGYFYLPTWRDYRQFYRRGCRLI